MTASFYYQRSQPFKAFQFDGTQESYDDFMLAFDMDPNFYNAFYIPGSLPDNGTIDLFSYNTVYPTDWILNDWYNPLDTSKFFVYTNDRFNEFLIDQKYKVFNDSYYTMTESNTLFIQNETDPIWNSEKTNYFTKTQTDARYLMSFTESDPVWLSEKNNYYTKSQGDSRYLQSYTETDPIWTADKVKYITKTQSDALYNQTLSINSLTVSISNGNSIAIPNQLQTLSINSGTLSISSGNSISLPSQLQNLSISGTALSISSGNTVNVPYSFAIATAMSSKSLNTAYQVSTTNDSRINVSAMLSCNLSLSGGQSGTIILEVSPNGSSAWVYIGQIDGSNTGTLTIGLNTTQITGGSLTAPIKAGYYWRLRTVNNVGTPTFTWNGGSQEIF